MKKRLTNNLSLKLISVISALLVWMVVVNINDPIAPRRFSNVPVRLLNTDIVTGNNQVYTVLDGSDTISTVTVMGQRSIVDSMQASDIIATADFNDMTSSGTIAISLSSSRYNSRLESIKGSSDSVYVNVEDVHSIQLVLQANTTGTPADGYIVGDVSMDENLIRISGPESIVSQISTAFVSVDVSGASGELTTNADVKLYNTDKIEVSGARLTKNTDTVRVNIRILPTKTVPVTFTVSGTPAEGYIRTGAVESSVTSVRIAGEAATLRGVSEITVPESVLDVSGLSESLEKTVDIKQYLPDGIRFADAGFSGKADVTVDVEREEKKELSVPVRNISIINLPEGFTAQLLDTEETEEELIFNVSGTYASVSLMNGANVLPYIDVSAYMDAQNIETLHEGHYTMPVHLVTASDVTVAGTNAVRVEVKKEEQTENTEGQTGAEDAAAADTAADTAGEAPKESATGAAE